MNAHRALAAAVIALAAAPALAAELPRAARDDWRWVENENFRVLTADSERGAEHLIDELERFRVCLSEMLPRFDQIAGPRPTFIVFDGDRAFEPYKTRDADGRTRDIVATFVGSDLSPQAAMADRSELSDRIILWGYFHLLFGNSLGDLPLWLRSGLPDFYSTFHYMPRTGEAQIGRAVPHYYNGWFPDLAPPPLSKLLEITRDDSDYQGGNQGLNFQARSWLLVHYLQIGPKGVPGALGRFLQLRAQGVAPGPALEATTGTSLVDLDRDLNSYITRARVAVLGVDLSDVEPSPIHVRRAATRAEVLYELGTLLARTAREQPDEAAAHFAAIEALEPGSPLAALGRGWIAHLDKRYADAAVEFADAVTKSPDSIEALLGLGFAVRYARQDDEIELDPTLLAKARAAAIHVVELAPSRDDAWEVLVGLRLGDPAEAELDETLDLFERGHAQRLDDHAISEVLVDLYVEAGRTKDARLLAESVLRADPTPSGRLERTVVGLEVREARDLERKGDGEMAIGQLEWRLRHTHDEEARNTVETAIAEIRAGLSDDLGSGEPSVSGPES